MSIQPLITIQVILLTLISCNSRQQVIPEIAETKDMLVIYDTTRLSSGDNLVISKYYDRYNGLILTIERTNKSKKVYAYVDCTNTYEDMYEKGQMLFSEYLNQPYIFDDRNVMSHFEALYKNSDSATLYNRIDSILFSFYKIRFSAHQKSCLNTFFKTKF